MTTASSRKLGLLLARFRAWIAEPLAVLIVVCSATTAIAQPFYVPSGSMEPTLAIGDALRALARGGESSASDSEPKKTPHPEPVEG